MQPSASSIRLKTDIRFPGFILTVFGLENRGIEVFQNFIGRERAACVAHLGANLISWQRENKSTLEFLLANKHFGQR